MYEDARVPGVERSCCQWPARLGRCRCEIAGFEVVVAVDEVVAAAANQKIGSTASKDHIIVVASDGGVVAKPALQPIACAYEQFGGWRGLRRWVIRIRSCGRRDVVP